MPESLEKYFEKFRNNVIGHDTIITTPYGEKNLVYADWTASGRTYKTIEEQFKEIIYPYVANTHTETSTTGQVMTYAYHQALHIIKKHVNASKDDVIISACSGMTGVVNKLQRILGLRVHEKYKSDIKFEENERPIVFVTHMEHHSNQTSWLETIAQVEIIPYNEDGLPCTKKFRLLLEKFKDVKLKIAAITSCSNVTGVITPYYDVAELIHEFGGYCFVDFACSAPYINIDMHPEINNKSLDAIYFSPHKFLGGPGSTGILIFNKKLYNNKVPDNPGGGTVLWTNPWGEHQYISDIEQREDGGTPAFLQTIKTALSIKLKEEISVNKIIEREKEIIELFLGRLNPLKNIHIIEENIKERLCVFSIIIDDLHYNLAVRLLNDVYGIQVRGGCLCAGTYSHYLLKVSKEESLQMALKANKGDFSAKPGWIRVSFNPIMSNKEVNYVIDSIIELSENHQKYYKDYEYNPYSNEFTFKNFPNEIEKSIATSFFELNF